MHCKHFGICGGCTVPGVPYPEQLAGKRHELSRLLGTEVPPVIPSPAEAGFRSFSQHLTYGRDDGDAAIAEATESGRGRVGR